VFAHEPTFPRGRKASQIDWLLNGAKRRGLIELESYKGTNRKPRERWRLSATGLEYIGVAPSAPSAPST
jgi:hypothetical protein